MTDVVDVVKTQILSALEKDELTLPTLPEIALKVREVAEDAEATIPELTHVLAQDAALAARIMRVCNSPLLRGSQEVKDLHMAVSRLGMNYTANLAIGLAMQQMFQATNPIIDQRLHDTWKATSRIAVLSALLAHKVGIPEDEATLAALMHRVGVLPLLTFAEERDDLIQDGISLDKVISRLHAGLGGIILKRWDFPEVLANVPKNYRKLEYSSESVDYVDLIQAANLIDNIGKNNPFGKADWSRIQSIQRVGLPTDPEDPEVQEIREKASASGSLYA